jgi:hypothetical protein
MQMANLGGNIGLHYGFLLDMAGPGIVLVLAGLLGCAGWGTLWASIYFAWPMHNYTWGLNVISFIQGQSQQALDTAVIPTITRHFSQDRGASIGITKAFVGLSGARVVLYCLCVCKGEIHAVAPANHQSMILQTNR